MIEIDKLVESTDAKVWAQEFMERFGDKLDQIDEGLMIGWFANAMIAQEIVLSKNSELIKALEFYGDANSYFAIAILPDPPCGEFMEDFDFSWQQWNPDEPYLYNRPMPGKRARLALGATEQDDSVVGDV